MKFTVDHDLHIHSWISDCSRDTEQTPERILRYASENGMKTICLTDHYWDSSVPGPSDWYSFQNDEWIRRAYPLPQEEGISFLFGCETDMREDLTLGISKSAFDRFDFVIIPTTHLHMKGFTITEEDASSAEGRARVWLRRLDALLGMDLPFHKIGIAHLVCGLILAADRKEYLRLLDMLPEQELFRLFRRAAEVGVGIELNSSDMNFSPEEADTVLRPFRIAKECGCKFYCGSDAHHPAGLVSSPGILSRAVEILELKESDKFHIGM